jgi:hypothetical protein
MTGVGPPPQALTSSSTSRVARKMDWVPGRGIDEGIRVFTALIVADEDGGSEDFRLYKNIEWILAGGIAAVHHQKLAGHI